MTSSEYKAHGPRSEYTGGSFGGFSEIRSTNVVGPADGFDTDPPVGKPRPSTTRQRTGLGKGQGESSGEHLSWERRVLLVLTRLQAAKGFKALPPELKAEVVALIGAAPDEALS